MTKLDELKTQMAEAVKVFQDTGNMELIQATSNAMNKAKAEIAKAQAEVLLKESEKLAGARELLAVSIHEAVITGKSLANINQSLKDVKAWGFTYKVDNAVPGAEDVRYKSVALTTAVVKTRKAGGGGGTTGKSKDEYGLSLTEIVDKFATPEELTAIAGADTNSKSWQLKVAVKKRAIAEGKLAPLK